MTLQEFSNDRNFVSGKTSRQANDGRVAAAAGLPVPGHSAETIRMRGGPLLGAVAFVVGWLLVIVIVWWPAVQRARSSVG